MAGLKREIKKEGEREREPSNIKYNIKEENLSERLSLKYFLEIRNLRKGHKESKCRRERARIMFITK